MKFNDLTKEQKLKLKECLLFKWQATTPFGMEVPVYEVDKVVSDEDLQKEYIDEDLDFIFKDENNTI